MTFRRHPHYRESRVEWLGDVPDHWSVSPLKRLVSLRSGGTPDKTRAEYWDGEIPWASAKDLKSDFLFDSQDHISQIAIDQGAASLTPAGSVLVVVRGMILAHTFPVVTAKVPMAINQDLKAIIPGPSLDPAYLPWLLRGSSQETIRRLDEAGHGTKALRMEAWASMLLPVPPLEEQRRITSFLSDEISAVDSLVAEQQRLIELLSEKRQAVITHVVTKGLNPDTPMKPSGVEWLGDVPSHWDVVRMRFLSAIQTGNRDTEDAVEDGRYPFFVRSQTVERIDSAPYDCEAVLTAGDGAGVGKVFHHYSGKFDVHQRVYMLNNFRRTSGLFLFHYLRENFYKVALEGGAKSTVDSLRRPVFANFPVCVPPIEEQAAIIQAVDRDSKQFEALSADAERAIALLQERRKALISAAVTGRIDVRSLAHVEAA